MRVREIMTCDLMTVSPTDSLAYAARVMKQADVGFVPVVNHGELAGLLTDRDIVVRAVADGGDASRTTVGDIMTPQTWTIEADKDITEAEELMRQKKVRRLLVLDHDQRLVGVLSLGDLAVMGNDPEGTERAMESISSPVKGGGRSSSDPYA